ncbi:MAG TPA: cytochrome P450 [Acidimicrobiales bacterium]
MVAGTDASAIELPPTWLDDDPEFDAYAAQDELTGSRAPDPYPEFRRFRAMGGVVRIVSPNPLDHTEGPRAWREGDPDDNVMIGLYSHAAVLDALRDWETFTSTAYAESMGLVFGHSILEMDPPEHTQHRNLVAEAFRAKVIERWESKLIREIISNQIDSFADRGHANLTEEFTIAYPVKVIAGLLGVPLEHWDWFRRRAIEEIMIGADVERGLEASRVLKEYFTQIIQYRRRDPGEDLISELVTAEIDGHTLSDEEILPFLMLLSPAGAETTYRSTGNLLYGLFTNPDQLEAVQADRSLIPQAIEEAIRWEAPLTGIGRGCTRDTEVHGVAIPAGASVTMGLGSANRDESVFGETSEEFDIFRPPKQHVAFAFGRHRCLGIHLARLEMKAAMELLLDRLPDLRLDPDSADDVEITGVTFRSPNQLPVVFTSA